ncbi:MAG: siderophore-interacting protein [Pseudacidovorax sp.]|nr:siderophore-interacting protein [Pseudacidovorax sp.]
MTAPDTRLVQDSPVAARRAGLIERTITRLWLRPARIVGVRRLSERFRLFDVQGDAWKGIGSSLGDKLQMKLDEGLAARTYTPIEWDSQTGTTQFLAYCHGTGPGSAWAERAQVGDERQFFGPRASLDMSGLASPAVFFGDETSFGLALALQRSANGRPFIFEVNDTEECACVLDALGLTARLVKRLPNDAHLQSISEALVPSVPSPESAFVVTGKASSIQHVSRFLKTAGVDQSRLRAKVYWATGKVGLD